MTTRQPRHRGGHPTLRALLESQSAGGILLMLAAAAAILTANSPLAAGYFAMLALPLGPLSLGHWINDALMAVFFLMVGLEIKREMLDGQLSTWSRRILPGVAALGGMAGPALVYLWFTKDDPQAMRGWAIPSATDIAFALGVLSLLGPRVPVSLKVFLAALAIIDDLGAVVIIALFYTGGVSLPDLAGAALVLAGLWLMNRRGVAHLGAWAAAGAVLWLLVLRSGVHPTLAGVLLALFIPLTRTPGRPEAAPAVSPLHRLEQALHLPVAFVIVPLFGFANAGVSLGGVNPASLAQPVTLGVALGLLLGKVAGILTAVLLLVRAGWAELPAGAGWRQILGVSCLCGIGFTMSLFIGTLAFGDPAQLAQVKIGILAGSLVAGSLGALILRQAPRR